jgi:hypothetical protein
MRTLPGLVLALCASIVAFGVSSRDSRAYREWVWGEDLFRPGAFPLKTSEAGPSYNSIPERLYRPPRRQNTERPPDRSSSDIRQQSSLAKQAAALAKQRAEFERPEATLPRERAKFQRQRAAGAQSPTVNSITCDAARAAVTDYGFKDVKPELCAGKTLRFGATRDGKDFSIEIAPNGELARVRRLYEGATGAIGGAQFRGPCWYAIFFCSRQPDEALRWTERHAYGHVIDTLSKEFPRLKKGYYCAVDGPLPRNVAVDKAQSSKLMGKAPAAYAKEGC